MKALIFNKKTVDEILPPFSDERREIRKQWNRLTFFVNWEDYLYAKALEKFEFYYNNHICVAV